MADERRREGRSQSSGPARPRTVPAPAQKQSRISRRSATTDQASAPDPVAPLALRPRQAATALGIGERLLWSLTNQRVIPHIKLGRAIVYPVRELERWLAERAGKGARP